MRTAVGAVLKGQLWATGACTLAFAVWLGLHGLLSSLMGGVLNIAAVALGAAVLRARPRQTSRQALAALLYSELSRVLLIVAGMWCVLAFYPRLEAAAFFSTFAITLLPFIVSLQSPSDKNTN